MSLTKDLVEKVLALSVDDLPEVELVAARSLFLDFLGVAARGASSDSAVVHRRALESMPQPAGPMFPIIGTSQSASAVTAAMANAVASHSIEYDDLHNASSVHPSVVIFPAAFAAWALTAASDAAFLRAVVVGYEVMCRVGAAAQPRGHYARHFHPTGTAGALGAAAAASVLLGLDVDGTVAAIGIAATGSSGSLEFLTDGAWTKRLNPALAARTGVEAAWLAHAGYTAPNDPIGGPNGFLRAFSDLPDPALLLAGWGTDRLAVSATSVKAHTCCRYNQGPIDAVLQAVQLHRLNPADVAKVTIGLPTAAVDIIAEPRSRKARPMSVVDAQFSLPFAVAVAVVHGRAGLDEYDDDRLARPELIDIMDRVEYDVDPEIDRAYPVQWQAWARIDTTDGRCIETRVNDPKGDPTNPLTTSELRSKFRALTSGVYGEARQSQIEELAGHLGEVGVLASLVPLLGSS